MVSLAINIISFLVVAGAVLFVCMLVSCIFILPVFNEVSENPRGCGGLIGLFMWLLIPILFIDENNPAHESIYSGFFMVTFLMLALYAIGKKIDQWAAAKAHDKRRRLILSKRRQPLEHRHQDK